MVVACRIVERWNGDEILGQYFFWCILTTEHPPHNATIATAAASMRSCNIIGGPTLQVDDDNTHSLMRFKSLEKTGYFSISLGLRYSSSNNGPVFADHSDDDDDGVVDDDDDDGHDDDDDDDDGKELM